MEIDVYLYISISVSRYIYVDVSIYVMSANERLDSSKLNWGISCETCVIDPQFLRIRWGWEEKLTLNCSILVRYVGFYLG